MVALTELTVPAELGFCHFTLDRADQKRSDAAWQEASFARDDARTYVIVGEQIVLQKRGETLDALFRKADLPAASVQVRAFIGMEGDAPRFALLLDPASEEPLKDVNSLALVGLRPLAIEKRLPADQLGALATAKALMFWHGTHRFCSSCGSASVPANAGWRRDCPQCKAMHFPRTDPVVIMLAVRGDKCLMGRQPRFVPGMYSCLAGFVEPGETIESAVRRELHEEAGVKVGRVRYLASQPWPFPESLMIGCLAEALSDHIEIDRTELEDARWFSRDEAKAILEKRHPGNIGAPGSFAIARLLLKSWAYGEAAL